VGQVGRTTRTTNEGQSGQERRTIGQDNRTIRTKELGIPYYGGLRNSGDICFSCWTRTSDKKNNRAGQSGRRGPDIEDKDRMDDRTGHSDRTKDQDNKDDESGTMRT